MTFVPPTLTLELLDASGNPTSDLVGTQQATVRATLEDANGPVVGEIIGFTASGGQLGQSSGLTNDNGQVTLPIIANDIVGVGTVDATTTLDETTVSSILNFRINDPNPGLGSVNLQVTVDRVTIAPLTQSTARVVVTREDGTPVEGAVVNFTASLVELTPASGSVFTDVNGAAQVGLRAGGTPGSTQLEVQVIIGEETFTASPVNLIVADAMIELVLSDYVVQANEEIEVQARLLEATEDRTPVPDTVIEFSSDIATFAKTSELTDENGMVTLIMVGGTIAGEGVVTATASINGNQILGIANFQSVGRDASEDNLSLAVSGLVDAGGNPDNVLAGNESATITATVVSGGELVSGAAVLFTSSSGTLSATSRTTGADGKATVQLSGPGEVGTSTVEASVTLSTGVSLLETIQIQTSAEKPSLRLIDSQGLEIENVELSAAQSSTITARIEDWNGTPVNDIGVTFSVTAVDSDVLSGRTTDGEVDVVLTGRQTIGPGTFSAEATFGVFTLTDSMTVTSLGVNATTDNLVIDRSAIVASLGSNIALDGNERVDVAVTVTQAGAPAQGVTVNFLSTGVGAGTLVLSSDVTDASGIANVTLIGLGIGGTTDITASAQLDNDIDVQDSFRIQTSAIKPVIDLVVRNSAGGAVDEFGAKDRLSLEASILDFDGSPLVTEDQKASVTFNLDNPVIGSLSTTPSVTTVQRVSQTGACPIVGTKTSFDCAAATLFAGTDTDIGTLSVSTTINGITIRDTAVVTNTGVNTTLTIQRDAILAALGSNTALDGNEKIDVEALVVEDGVAQSGVTIQFTSTGGTLLSTSDVTDPAGAGSVRLIGLGIGGTITLTATATLDGDIELTDTFTIQASALKPVIELVGKTSGGVVVDSFAANQEITLEAVVRDFDGNVLDADDTKVAVTFALPDGDIGSFDEANALTTIQKISAQSVCLASGGGVDSADCAAVTLFSGNVADVSTITASATINGIAVQDATVFTNTGVSSVLRIQKTDILAALGANAALDGNEKIDVAARITDGGVNQPGVTVSFTTTAGGTLGSTNNVTGSDGLASVQLIGAGEGGTITITARASLDGGIELTDSYTIQTSSLKPVLTLVVKDGSGDVVSSVGAGQQLTLEARIVDFDGADLDADDRNALVNFAIENGDFGSFNANEIVISAQDVSAQNACNDSGVPVSADCAVVTLKASNNAVVRGVTATATINGIDVSATKTVNNSGVNATLEVQDAVILASLGTNNALDGNERVDLDVIVRVDGVEKDGVTVLFNSAGTLDGVLVDVGAVTGDGAPAGTARLELIGRGIAGSSTITVTADLEDDVTLTDTIVLQTSSVRPVIDLTLRNGSGTAITSFGANQAVTLEATIVDFDGADLSTADENVSVTFISNNEDLGSFDEDDATVEQAIDVSAKLDCPASGINANSDSSDCAVRVFYSGTENEVGSFTAQVTINEVLISDTLTVTNTGINSGAPDQNSFTITRIQNDLGFATDATVSIEGDRFNNEEIDIRVDLADFFNNPVPNGTLVEFTTELGDITPSCPTVDGTCTVTFTSADPRTPDSSEVSFRNVDDDMCPSRHIDNEIVTLFSNGAANVGLTDYRVSEILRVVQTGGDGSSDVTADVTVLQAGVDYNGTSNGVECIAGSAICTAGTEVAVTYRRLWLDEEDDGAVAHVLLNPGEATAPFLNVTGIPCLAHLRERKEQISGSVNPQAATTTVTGVGTKFKSELAVGDQIKISGEVRSVVSIASDTQLTIDTSFSDNLNDTSPERLAAPAYRGGLGQPYGGRSTIVAFAVGEESFIDVNNNQEYDFGETFFDLTESFIDKNEDGVLGDFDGDSDTAQTVGPYRDAGLGDDPPGASRDKSDPYCYGPLTIVRAADGVNDSTEQLAYCYQDGGEEESFIDFNGNGIMDLGNGIYNGSRCLTPDQGVDLDGDGTDDPVCTTDLVNISRSVQVLMAGSLAKVSFRSYDADGGTFHGAGFYDTGELSSTSGGELISRIVAAGGVENERISNGGFGNADDWSQDSANTSIEQGKAIFTSATSEDLLSQDGVFVADLSHAISIAVKVVNAGTFDILASGSVVATCAAAGNCTATVTPSIAGSLKISTSAGFDGEIDDVSVISTSSGPTQTYALSDSLRANGNPNLVPSNDNSAFLEEFEVGDITGVPATDAVTTFPGISERLGVGLWTTNNFIIIDITDRFNGHMPEGTVVTVTSDNSSGCLIQSVQGVAVDEPNQPSVHSGTATIGNNVRTRVFVSLAPGNTGGPLQVDVSTLNPDGTTGRSFVSRSITCDL